MTRQELIAALEAEFSAAMLEEHPLRVHALGEILRPLVARHAAAWRAQLLRQREPDPNGGPPEGGTPGAARGEKRQAA